jgi:signal transduction histidine kinase/CheY-like chemotaxis protein
MLPRLFKRAAASPDDSWQFHIDVQEADRRKRERLVDLNTVTLPKLRLLGYALVSLTVLLHNHLVFGAVNWDAWMRLNGALFMYCAASWYLLHLFYADLKPYFDLGVAFLVMDLGVDAIAVHASGAENSWLFFLPIWRVVDQTPVSMRRALVFAHLAPLSYLGVVMYVVGIEGREIAVPPELAKLAVIYTASLYTAMVAHKADLQTRSMTGAIGLARQLVGELGRKSEALEASSSELQQALASQSQLANENAMLYASAQRDRARQQQIFDSASDGILLVGRDGRIEAANVRAGELLVFEPAKVIGSELARFVSRLYSAGHGESFLPTLNRLIEDPWAGGQGDLEQPATGRVLHWSAQPAREVKGGLSGLTFTFQDVTPARDLLRQLEDKSRLLEEARLKSEDANRAKGEFLANVSHEIRTPLSAIIGMAQHMEDTGASENMVRRIRTSAEGLMAIINDILDFSKIESRRLTLDRAPFSLRATLHETVDSLQGRAGEKHLALSLEVAGDAPDALIGDAMRLQQVLHNLLGNALKFTESGEVRLRVGIAAALPDEVCLHFGVTDTGIGIPLDKQDVVFEAFSQADGSAARRYGGTGLGLSISTRLVELMRGDLWVESEAGEGSTFRFTATFALARADDEAAARFEPPAVQQTRRSVTVLVVEDEDVHRELLTALLAASGHRVVTATNGREALQELARTPVHVVLMDLQTPETDGFQAASTIRGWEQVAGGHLPIIGMSASAVADEQARCRAAGMDRFVSKPIARDTLFSTLEELSLEAPSAAVPPELAGRPAFLAGLGDDVVLARRLVEIFVEQSAALMGQLRAAIAAGDATALRKAAHALKGTIGNFPDGSARVVATRMEAIAVAGDLADARAVLPLLEQEVDRLKTLLPALI